MDFAQLLAVGQPDGATITRNCRRDGATGLCVQCGAEVPDGMNWPCKSHAGNKVTFTGGTKRKGGANRANEEREKLLSEIAANEPGLLEKAKKYSLAILRWTAAGKPTRSAEEIEATLAICRECDYFTDKGKPRCQKCGCPVNNLPEGLKNKIAMATEHCPLSPPKW